MGSINMMRLLELVVAVLGLVLACLGNPYDRLFVVLWAIDVGWQTLNLLFALLDRGGFSGVFGVVVEVVLGLLLLLAAILSLVDEKYRIGDTFFIIDIVLQFVMAALHFMQAQ